MVSLCCLFYRFCPVYTVFRDAPLDFPRVGSLKKKKIPLIMRAKKVPLLLLLLLLLFLKLEKKIHRPPLLQHPTPTLEIYWCVPYKRIKLGKAQTVNILMLFAKLRMCATKYTFCVLIYNLVSMSFSNNWPRKST